MTSQIKINTKYYPKSELEYPEKERHCYVIVSHRPVTDKDHKRMGFRPMNNSDWVFIEFINQVGEMLSGCYNLEQLCSSMVEADCA